MRPLIGITPDIDADGARHFVRPPFALAITAAGGVPVVLGPHPELVAAYLERCDAFILTGGDDPIMEDWGVPTHPKATPIHPVRQAFERALLAALDERPEIPLLGICLGMQLMTLEAGGAIDQHLPETDPAAAARHWGRIEHAVHADMPWGRVEAAVLSHHRQVMTDPGDLIAAGTCPDDGMIEVVIDPRGRFRLGVQWHPERTDDPRLGAEIFSRLIEAAVGA